MLDQHNFSSYPGLLCTGDKQSDKGTLDDMGGKTVFVVFVSCWVVVHISLTG
jgi:hypothetical protein